jgi:hypothetical protein
MAAEQMEDIDPEQMEDIDPEPVEDNDPEPVEDNDNPVTTVNSVVEGTKAFVLAAEDAPAIAEPKTFTIKVPRNPDGPAVATVANAQVNMLDAGVLPQGAGGLPVPINIPLFSVSSWGGAPIAAAGFLHNHCFPRAVGGGARQIPRWLKNEIVQQGLSAGEAEGIRNYTADTPIAMFDVYLQQQPNNPATVNLEFRKTKVLEGADILYAQHFDAVEHDQLIISFISYLKYMIAENALGEQLGTYLAKGNIIKLSMNLYINRAHSRMAFHKDNAPGVFYVTLSYDNEEQQDGAYLGAKIFAAVPSKLHGTLDPRVPAKATIGFNDMLLIHSTPQTGEDYAIGEHMAQPPNEVNITHKGNEPPMFTSRTEDDINAPMEGEATRPFLRIWWHNLHPTEVAVAQGPELIQVGAILKAELLGQQGPPPIPLIEKSRILAQAMAADLTANPDAMNYLVSQIMPHGFRDDDEGRHSIEDGFYNQRGFEVFNDTLAIDYLSPVEAVAGRERGTPTYQLWERLREVLILDIKLLYSLNQIRRFLNTQPAADRARFAAIFQNLAHLMFQTDFFNLVNTAWLGGKASTPRQPKKNKRTKKNKRAKKKKRAKKTLRKMVLRKAKQPTKKRKQGKTQRRSRRRTA